MHNKRLGYWAQETCVCPPKAEEECKPEMQLIQMTTWPRTVNQNKPGINRIWSCNLPKTEWSENWNCGCSSSLITVYLTSVHPHLGASSLAPHPNYFGQIFMGDSSETAGWLQNPYDPWWHAQLSISGPKTGTPNSRWKIVLPMIRWPF